MGYYEACDPDKTEPLESLFYSRSAIEETIINNWFYGSIFSNLINWNLKKIQAKIEKLIQEKLKS